MSNSTSKSSETIRGLNELLRGELAALETYNQALSVVTGDRETEDDLRECQSSHRERVDRLRMEITERGGTPDTGSGAWGLFAKVVEGTAKTVGQKMAINALEAGEDHGMKEYEQLLPKLDGAARDIVETAIYPQQMRTHRIMSVLKHKQGDAAQSRAGS